IGENDPHTPTPAPGGWRHPRMGVGEKGGGAADGGERTAATRPTVRIVLMAVSYRVNEKPDGWLEPWTLTWQFEHCRPSMNLSEAGSVPYGVVGCRGSTWHCWQRRGFAIFRISSWFGPWGWGQ